MSEEPSWDLYRSFLAVIRTASLSSAARALGTTQPTVGRHIDALEAALGMPLFVRSRHGLAPTEPALDLVPHAETMAAASAALARAATGEAEEERGSVRLTASDIVGVEILPTAIKKFRVMHPAINIELVLTNRTENLLRREADLAVRMMRPTQETLVARKMGDVPIFLYAHKAYAKKFGVPETLGQAANHTVIGPDTNVAILDAIEAAGLKKARAVITLKSDSDLAQLAMLRAGCGIGGMQKQLAARDRNMVPILHEAFQIPMEMWLVMHENLRGSHRIRLLYDHLATHLTQYVRITD